MKKLVMLMLCMALVLPMSYGDVTHTIKKNGVNQGDLVNALKSTQTLVNELAADHDADNATVAELVVDHDADNNVMDDLKTAVNGLRTYLNDGMLAHGTLLISGTLPEDFKTTTTVIFTLSGVAYAKVAEDDLDFSAAYTVNTGAAAGTLWGAFLVQTTSAGVISTKAVGADQAYASEAAAIAALPSADALNVAIGYITVNANEADAWVANTDDLTPTSDLLDANFYNIAVKAIPSAVSSSPAANLTATASAADLTADAVLGSGTEADPAIDVTA